MKFCKDCIHMFTRQIQHLRIGSASTPIFGAPHAYCTHVKLTIVDPVWGDEHPRLCSEERASTAGYCGPEGKLFEPRQ